MKNSIRVSTDIGAGYPRSAVDDNRFVENHISVNAIAASSGQNDSGVFELNFRDERYLTFEGAGVISEWSLELFHDASADFGRALRQFDYSTISDVILHIKYTAREEIGAFKDAAITNLRNYFADAATPSLRMLNLRQEFPTQWQRFLNPPISANGNIFELEMSPDLFPFRDTAKTLKINTIWLLARCTSEENYNVVITPPLPDGSNAMILAQVDQYGVLHLAQKDITTFGIKVMPTTPFIKWQLKMTRANGGNLQRNPDTNVMEVEDILLVLGYEWE